MKKIIKMVLLITGMLLLTGCGKTTVNLNEYITIQAEGCDTLGILAYEFDSAKFEADYGEKIKVKEANEKVALDLAYGATPVEAFLDVYVNPEFSDNETLSNGDVVTLEWNIDAEEVAECFNIDVQCTNIEYEVSGLREPQKINPFDYVQIEITGTTPYAQAELIIDETKEELSCVTFEMDVKEGLDNGDVITITAAPKMSNVGMVSLPQEDLLFKKYEAVLTETEMTYTVEGIQKYVTDPTEIPSDNYATMQQIGIDVYKDYVNENWNAPESLNDITCMGYFILTPNEFARSGPGNCLYLVYKVTASNPETAEPFEYYYYTLYENVVLSADGTLQNDINVYETLDMGTYSTQSFYIGRYKYIGYETLADLVNRMYVRKWDTYNYSTDIAEIVSLF